MSLLAHRSRSSQRRRPLALLLLSTIVLLSTVGAAITPAPGTVQAAGGTTTANLNLRDGPGTSYRVLMVMPAGSSVSINGDARSGFFPLTYNGTEGWASGDYLSLDTTNSAPSGNTATVTARLNLRTGPSLADIVILVMPAGSTVTLRGNAANGFQEVSYNGTFGWAFGEYLSTGTPPPPTDGGTDTGTATVTARLNLRTGPSTSDVVLTVMPVGATVTLTGRSSNGFRSVTYSGTAGWAFGDYLSTGGSGGTPPPSGEDGDSGSDGNVSAPYPGSGTAVTTTELSLRAGPSSTQSVVTVMPAGATVTLTGIGQNGYYYVVYGTLKGWAAATYLATGGSPSRDSGYDAYSEQQIIDIIYAAADRYGQPREDMLRVARCESDLEPYAVNPTGSYGLFQFIRSTWNSTPYAEYDIFDPWASANAAGWMWSVGRRAEWVCQ